MQPCNLMGHELIPNLCWTAVLACSSLQAHPTCRATPLGLRYHEAELWGFLRIASTSAFTAATYATMPGVPQQDAQKYFCYARSQLGYALGESTGLSYVNGFGKNYVTRVHHRDSVCTLEEDASGKCVECGSYQLTLPACPAVLLCRGRW